MHPSSAPLQCPVCRHAMKEVIKESISIDVCTQCHGVWLDRGELDKILQSVRNEQPPQYAAPPSPSPSPSYRRYDDDDLHHYPHQNKHSKYHKKSTIERLFDIFD